MKSHITLVSPSHEPIVEPPAETHQLSSTVHHPHSLSLVLFRHGCVTKRDNRDVSSIKQKKRESEADRYRMPDLDDYGSTVHLKINRVSTLFLRFLITLDKYKKLKIKKKKHKISFQKQVNFPLTTMHCQFAPINC